MNLAQRRGDAEEKTRRCSSKISAARRLCSRIENLPDNAGGIPVTGKSRQSEFFLV
jgi:hypothetical protein